MQQKTQAPSVGKHPATSGRTTRAAPPTVPGAAEPRGVAAPGGKLNGELSGGLSAGMEELEERVGQLAALCVRLREENEALRKGHRRLEQERAERVSRNHQARTRLNSVLLRLRDMEQQ